MNDVAAWLTSNGYSDVSTALQSDDASELKSIFYAFATNGTDSTGTYNYSNVWS